MTEIVLGLQLGGKEMGKFGRAGGQEKEKLISLAVEFHVLGRAVYWKHYFLKGFFEKVLYSKLLFTYRYCSQCLNKMGI